MATTRQKQAPEVKGVVSSQEVLKALLPPFSHVEVREAQSGGWTVWYPDPGWIPCAPACRLKETHRDHKHDYEQPWVKTNYIPTSYEDALEWAELLADGKEVKVIHFKSLAERNAERRLKAAA